jgi:hypothetical protein
MNDRARLISSDLRPADEAELTRSFRQGSKAWAGGRSTPPTGLQRPILPQRSYALFRGRTMSS